MRLDPDCVRDILITVENHSGLGYAVSTSHFIEDGLIAKYSQLVVLYHLQQADEAGLMTGVDYYYSGFSVLDLSPAGHDFLAKIRSDNNWSKTKTKAATIGVASVKALVSVATQVVASAVQNTLHLG